VTELGLAIAGVSYSYNPRPARRYALRMY